MSSAPIPGAATPLIGTRELTAPATTPSDRAADVSSGRQQAVAEDFEAILLGHLLKGLRRTVPESEDTSQMRQLYQDLFDEQLAADLARKGGIGLAAVIKTYLEQGTPATGGHPR